MMTVRFSTGFSIQYNDAHHVKRYTAGYVDLYTKDPEQGGRWIAQIPIDAVVESVPARRTYNPISDCGQAHANQIERVERELRAVKRELALARKARS